MILNRLLKHCRSRRASVTVLAATLFPVLVGMAGLATAYGDALLTKLKAQRIADAAAYSGAVAYNQLSTSSAITTAADRVATINGISTGAISASLVNSPSGDGNSAVEATVTMSVNVGLAQLISNTSTLSVTANSYVEFKGSTNGIPCIIALASGGTGVTLSGSGKITANTCAVASNSTTAPAITAPSSSATVTSPVVSTPAALTSAQKAHILPPSGTSSVTYLVKTVSDPLAGKTAVTTLTGHLASVGLLGNPTFTAPTTGTSINFTGSSSGTLPTGCTSSLSSKTWTITCTGAGPFNFGAISLGGGISVIFNDTTTATYNFSGSVANTGSGLTFNGNGTYNIGGGVYTGGGTTTAFNGTGTYNIGKYTSSCSGDNVSICHTGNALTFAGPSTFVLTNGLYVSGGEPMTMGSGSTQNSYQIGASTNGWAINMGGGAKLTLNDATGTGGLFRAAGNITNGGGSCMTLPAAGAHDINGYITVAGGTTLGTGVYTINGYLGVGAISGGTVTCGGVSSIGLSAIGVTLVIGGNSTVTCSSIATAFCIAGGYSNVVLTAPTSGSTTNIAVLGPTTSTNTASAVLSAGASGANISGAFYIPYGQFNMSGGASVGGGGCFEVIADEVTLSGGTAVASACTGLTGSSLLNQSLVLVQ